MIMVAVMQFAPYRRQESISRILMRISLTHVYRGSFILNTRRGIPLTQIYFRCHQDVKVLLVMQLLPYATTAGMSSLHSQRREVIEVAAPVFSGLRVYALSERKTALCMLVVLLSLVPIPINSVGVQYNHSTGISGLKVLLQYVTVYHVHLIEEYNPAVGSYCLISVDLPAKLTVEYVRTISSSGRKLTNPRQTFVVLSVLWVAGIIVIFTVTLVVRFSVILADIIVVLVTWAKTFSMYRSCKVYPVPRNQGLSSILLRDGKSAAGSCTMSF